MTNHDELVAFLVQLGHFNMYLGHQWAGGVKYLKTAPLGLQLNRLAHAVRAEDQRGTGRHVGQLFNKNRALLFQVIDHVGVVNNFVAHINRRAKFAQGALNNFNRAVNACAKAAWFCQQDFLRECCHKTPITWTSKLTGCPANG